MKFGGLSRLSQKSILPLLSVPGKAETGVPTASHLRRAPAGPRGWFTLCLHTSCSSLAFPFLFYRLHESLTQNDSSSFSFQKLSVCCPIDVFFGDTGTSGPHVYCSSIHGRRDGFALQEATEGKGHLHPRHLPFS